LKPQQARAATGEVLARVGLDGAASRPVGQYTKGMRQRLGLAQALAHEPPVLLLDEPTAGVDPRGVADMLALMGQLKSSGRTVLLSSHLLEEVGEICDRVVILAQGREVYRGGATSRVTGQGDWESFATEPMSAPTRAALAAWLKERGHSLQGGARQRPGLTEAYLAHDHAGAEVADQVER